MQALASEGDVGCVPIASRAGIHLLRLLGRIDSHLDALVAECTAAASRAADQVRAKTLDPKCRPENCNICPDFSPLLPVFETGVSGLICLLFLSWDVNNAVSVIFRGGGFGVRLWFGPLEDTRFA